MPSKIKAGGLLVFVASLSQTAEWKTPPLSFFTPSVELSERDREHIRNGRVVANTIESAGHELAVFAAGSLDITPELFVSRVQEIVALRQSRFVPALGRFSNPPTLGDLAGLTLEEQDVEDLVSCRAGDCGLKLGDSEIRRMHAALAGAGSNRRTVALNAFREILLERVRTYLSGGLHALPPYHDKSRPLDLAQAFDGLVRRSVYLGRVPRFRTLLLEAPRDSVAATSFLYWAVEDFGLRPVTRVTHVVIVRPNAPDLPEVLVGSIQVYASHYIDAALAVTALERPSGDAAYLGYLYQARVDALTNFLVRWIVERRIRADVKAVFRLQLRRLEAGR
jgi:hypothetical protein